MDPSPIIEKNCLVYEVSSWFFCRTIGFLFPNYLLYSNLSLNIKHWISNDHTTTKVSTVFLTGGSPLGTIIFIGKFSYQGEHMCL